MKARSAAYKSGMREVGRKKSHVRVLFYNIDTEAAKDGQWMSTDAVPWSDTAALDGNTTYEKTAATLELNRWVLGSDQALVPIGGGGFADGYVSSSVSGADGRFPSPPVLVRRFSKPRTFRGLTVTFDTRVNEWPVQITVLYYLAGERVGSSTVLPEGVTVEIPNEAAQVDRVDLRFDRLLPYRRARVQTVLFGYRITFTGRELLEVTQSHNVDPITRRLPEESASFTLLDTERRYDPDPDNKKSEYKFVNTRSPILIQHGLTLSDGTVEWLKPDRYLLDGKPKFEMDRATFSATGLIATLTGEYYKSKVGEKTLYDMAEGVLRDAGLDPTGTGAVPWVIDDALKEWTTDAVLPIATHAACLQLIAHAGCCRLFTDSDNVIHIERRGINLADIYHGTWSDNGHTDWSEWESVDEGGQPERAEATFELNRWVLDGQFDIGRDGDRRGYVSAAVSDATGAFNAPPVFSKTFDRARDARLVRLVFGAVAGEYPRLISCAWYSESGALLDTVTLAPDGPEARFVSENAVAVKRVTFTVHAALPYRRARVAKAFFRETDYLLDFDAMTGDRYLAISVVDELKDVTVAKYVYIPEESDANDVDVVDLDKIVFTPSEGL